MEDHLKQTNRHREKISPGAAPRVLRPSLVFMRGEMLAAPIPLERAEVVMGRALEADVRVNDVRVSRKHARIRTEQDADGNAAYRLTDLGSTNGTLVNGEPIATTFLHNGDKITLGSHVLRFELLDDLDREFQVQIHRLLAHDELTGLLTSKSFFSELRREAARAGGDNRPFCVLMMDIDHFKKVNDTYGHLTGHRTLEEIGGVIRGALRTGDVAARFGGEEFAAFLLDATCAQALVAAERVRASVEAFEFPVVRLHENDKLAPFPNTHHITISIGIAIFPDDARDPVELVELADSALYRAKNSGRNRVCLYRSPPETDEPLPVRAAVAEDSCDSANDSFEAVE